MAFAQGRAFRSLRSPGRALNERHQARSYATMPRRAGRGSSAGAGRGSEATKKRRRTNTGPSAAMAKVVDSWSLAYFPPRIRGRVAQLVRALLSHSRGPGFESLRAHSMKISLSHVAASLLLVATIATVGTAQVPTTQQAQQMLQNPDLVNQLRQQLTTSGLTPDQVRARLTAEGYPPNMLDAYLPGGTAGARDSLPGDDVFNAMRALGVSDSADVETLRGAGNQYQRSLRARRDSLTGRTIDPRTGLPRAELDTVIKKPASEQVFGLNVFRSTTSEFQPNLSGPVDANYRLGPGDQLVLILTGDVELTRTLDVTREG